ncbi:MAG: 2-hydroxyacyl-CoA dehydratase [Clostridia bacterium]|nr:2-hydroxyacyl-CoA dehydratase [Clostridia bacterium]
MTLTEVMQQLEDACRYPKLAVQKWKEQTGGLAIGWTPYYMPRELISALGMLPVGMWGGQTAIAEAHTHLQSFSCSLVRGILELGLKGTYRILDGVVFPSSCDHLQSLSDIWKKVFPNQCQADLVYPMNRRHPSALAYLKRTLCELADTLSLWSGRPLESEKLRQTIIDYNRNRELMRSLSWIRAQNPGRLRPLTMAHALKAGLFLPVDEHNRLLEALLAEVKLNPRRSEPTTKARLLLTGIMAEPESILEIIEQLGATVVADNLALGGRQYRHDVVLPPGEDLDDLMLALAQMYLSLDYCSTLFDPAKSRGEYYRQLFQETGATGIVVINMKFCEMEEFDYPYIKEDLEEWGIPHLWIEIEQQMGSLAQIRTRLQAFIEMLEQVD